MNSQRDSHICNRRKYLRNSLVLPIVLRLVPKLDEEARAINQWVVKPVSSSLDDPNSDIGIFAEAGGDNETGSATADNDVVVRLANEVTRRHLGMNILLIMY